MMTNLKIPILPRTVIPLILLCCTGCNQSSTGSAFHKQEYKVAVIQYAHETCTFCPGGDSEIDDWMRGKGVIEDEDLLNSSSYIQGFVERAHDCGDMALVGLRSPVSVFGGSSRSWNSEESFEYFMGMIIEDVKLKMSGK